MSAVPETFAAILDRSSRCMAEGMVPIPVVHPAIGPMGHVTKEHGFRVAGIRRSSFDAIIRDEQRALAIRAEKRRGLMQRLRQWNADRKLTEQHILRELGALTSYDAVLAKRAAGAMFDYAGIKASQTTVANAWSSFLRTSGSPGALAPANIPGGTVCNHLTAGAWPIIKGGTAGDQYVLTNLGANHATGTNVILWVDVLVGAANINANTTTSNTVNTSALTRKTSGENVCYTYEVSAALGATPSNVTTTYTNQAGTGSRSSGAIAMTASAIVGRLQPVQNGWMGPLQAGDTGVRSIQSTAFSAAMGAGVVIAWLFNPLCFVPSLAATTFPERSTPASIGGLIRLEEGSDSALPCMGAFVLTSTTSTGVQTYFTQTAWG